MDIVSYLLGKEHGGVTPTGEISITENGIHNVSGYATANVDVEPDLESKEVTITTNTTTTITPTQGKDGLSGVNVITNVQPNLETKSVTITENTTTTITPTSGKDGMSSVEVTTNVSGGADLSDYFISNTNSGSSSAPGILWMIKSIPDNTVATSDMSYTFARCVKFTNFPLIDTSNTTKLYYTFDSCTALTTIPLLNTSNVTDMRYTFNSCFALTTVPALNTSKVTDMRSMFYNCIALSNESLNNIMQMCINTTSAYNKTKTLSYIGISSSQATTCQGLSNYQAFLDAGWTTGYSA